MRMTKTPDLPQRVSHFPQRVSHLLDCACRTTIAEWGPTFAEIGTDWPVATHRNGWMATTPNASYTFVILDVGF